MDFERFTNVGRFEGDILLIKSVLFINSIVLVVFQFDFINYAELCNYFKLSRLVVWTIVWLVNSVFIIERLINDDAAKSRINLQYRVIDAYKGFLDGRY